MSRGRPELPNSFIVDLNNVIHLTQKEMLRIGAPQGWDHTDIDIVIPVYEAFKEDTAQHIVWILDKKMFSSTKSRFVEPIEARRGLPNSQDIFHIYDRWKSDSFGHKKSYKQFMVEIPYPEEGVEPLYIPVYWRVN